MKSDDDQTIETLSVDQLEEISGGRASFYIEVSRSGGETRYETGFRVSF